MRQFSGRFVMTKELITQIKSVCILKCVSDENIIKYFSTQNTEIVNFKAGAAIYSPLNTDKKVGIILSGRALAEPVGANTGALLKVLSKSDIFGIANLFCEEEPFVSIINAKTACKVLFIDALAFRKLIENDPAVLHAYLAFMSNRLVFLNKKIATLTAGSTEKKLAAFILEHEVEGVFSPDISMSYLADILNIGRASLYRALEMFEKGGSIKKDGKAITIIDRDALSKIN